MATTGDAGDARAMDSTEEIFQALFDGDVPKVKSARGFDWQASHPLWGTPLLALMTGMAPTKFDFVSKRALVWWCILQGACPEAHAPRCCKWRMRMCGQELCIGGQSALSAACFARQTAEDALSRISVDDLVFYYETRRCLKFWREVSDLLFVGGAQMRETMPRVQVSEGVVNIWEKLYNDRSMTTADVVLVSKAAQHGSSDAVESHGVDRGGGNTSSEARHEVRAHRVVLSAASKVWQAMLQPGKWPEGQHGRVETEASLAAVEHLVALIYTGCLSEEMACLTETAETAELAIQIETAELVKRYDIRGLWKPLITRLEGCMSVECFDTLCSFAYRHDESRLLAACKLFVIGQKTSESRAQFETWTRSLSPKVQDIVDTFFGQGSKKRRRLAL